MGQLKEAVNVLQRHFELLKAITSSQGGGDKDKNSGDNTPTVTVEDLELARVFVGISRGNLLMESYMHTIAFDMSALLDWKLNRTELLRQPTTTTETQQSAA